MTWRPCTSADVTGATPLLWTCTLDYSWKFACSGSSSKVNNSLPLLFSNFLPSTTNQSVACIIFSCGTSNLRRLRSTQRAGLFTIALSLQDAETCAAETALGAHHVEPEPHGLPSLAVGRAGDEGLGLKAGGHAAGLDHESGLFAGAGKRWSDVFVVGQRHLWRRDQDRMVFICGEYSFYLTASQPVARSFKTNRLNQGLSHCLGPRALLVHQRGLHLHANTKIPNVPGQHRRASVHALCATSPGPVVSRDVCLTASILYRQDRTGLG